MSFTNYRPYASTFLRFEIVKALRLSYGLPTLSLRFSWIVFGHSNDPSFVAQFYFSFRSIIGNNYYYVYIYVHVGSNSNFYRGIFSFSLKRENMNEDSHFVLQLQVISRLYEDKEKLYISYLV